MNIVPSRVATGAINIAQVGTDWLISSSVSDW